MKKLLIVIFFSANTNLFSQWYQSNWPVSSPSSFFFKDSLSGLIIGNDYPYRTWDGGKTWYNTQSPATFLDSKLYFINDETGFAYRYSIKKTTDMGNSWENVTPAGYHEFLDMCFSDDSTGYIAGGGGEIYVTYDQGATWKDISYQKIDGVYLYKFYFSGKSSGWITGNGFRLLTSDGGRSWTKENYDYDIRKISFFSPDSGYALLSGRGQLLKTVDGGMNWAKISMPFSFYNGELTSLCFLNNKTGFAGGGSAVNNYLYGRIYKTTDGGSNWSTIYESNISSEVYELFFYNENLGWAISSVGLLRTTSGGSEYIEGITAHDKNYRFELSPNYPNPFNPSTAIRFSLEKPGFVNITVYDILGRAVKTLVNGYKNAGNHIKIFDAGDLTSGVYFYRLTQGNKSLIKKMVLLK